MFAGLAGLAGLLTGFKKTLIFHLLRLVNEGCVVVVLFPLKSIVNDIIKSRRSYQWPFQLPHCLNGLSKMSRVGIIIWSSAEGALERKFFEDMKQKEIALQGNLTTVIYLLSFFIALIYK